MAIPSYKYLRYSFLQYAADGQEHSIQETITALAEHFDLSDEDREKLTSNGRYPEFDYRLRWVKTYLTKAQLIESTGRGVYRITERGYDFLEQTDGEITRSDLMQFPEFEKFATPSNDKDENTTSVNKITPSTDNDELNPEDLISHTYQQLEISLTDDLLDTVIAMSPAFFERMVVDLLLAMGYGSTLDSGERIGRSGDGGIDGIIREDKLGLDTIYIQAKRYDRNNGVGRPSIQAFAGSLMGEGAAKGVFITTSYFSSQAWQYADSLTNLKVILIDGEQLGKLLIEHNVGVSVKKTYTIKQIDENYFPDV